MAIGTMSDYKIYDEQVHGGLVETLVQNTDAFNAASRGCILMSTNMKKGHFDYESFFTNTANLIQRRDITAVTAVTDEKVAQDEFISVKLNRRIGPVTQTLDSFRKIGSQADVNSLSFLIGTQIAKAQMVGWLNDILAGMRAFLDGQAGVVEDDTAGTVTTLGLVDALSKFGDASDRVGLWVMHSKVFWELVKDQISNYSLDSVAGFNIATGTPLTLNRPVLVTDASSLIVSGTPDVYYTLGLTAGAGRVEQSEQGMVHAEIVTGLENLAVRMQGEYAFNLGVKGSKWDVANGGINPDATAIGTSTNWDVVLDSVKDLAGVVLKTQ